jgi:hypothetical protein
MAGRRFLGERRSAFTDGRRAGVRVAPTAAAPDKLSSLPVGMTALVLDRSGHAPGHDEGCGGGQALAGGVPFGVIGVAVLP